MVVKDVTVKERHFSDNLINIFVKDAMYMLFANCFEEDIKHKLFLFKSIILLVNYFCFRNPLSLNVSFHFYLRVNCETFTYM